MTLSLEERKQINRRNSVKSGGGFFTTERTQRLRELWRAGVTIPVIARAFGCSRNTVIGKKNRLKLRLRKIDALHWRSTRGRALRASIGHGASP
jgi:hypothetical protein